MPNPLKGASNISQSQGESGRQEKEREAGETNII